MTSISDVYTDRQRNRSFFPPSLLIFVRGWNEKSCCIFLQNVHSNTRIRSLIEPADGCGNDPPCRTRRRSSHGGREFFFFFYIYSYVRMEQRCCKMYVLYIYIFIRHINDPRTLISKMYLLMCTYFIKQINDPPAMLYSIFGARFQKCIFQCIRILY